MRASVVIATHNRGPIIDQTVTSVLASDLPVAEWELILIDNRSAPESRRHLMDLAGQHPSRIKYYREDAIGLSHARNRGVIVSTGPVIVFLDDDAVVPSYWLRRIVETFDSHADVGVAGGPVIPQYTTPPPVWLDSRLARYLSTFDHGDMEGPLEHPESPRGANMAFRRIVFDRCGMFLSGLGRKGSSLLSYEDTEMCYRAQRAGFGMRYIPDAEVLHLIRGDRLDEAWFENRFYWQGRSEAIFELIHYGHQYVARNMCRHLGWLVSQNDQLERARHRGFLRSASRNFLRRRFD